MNRFECTVERVEFFRAISDLIAQYGPPAECDQNDRCDRDTENGQADFRWFAQKCPSGKEGWAASCSHGKRKLEGQLSGRESFEASFGTKVDVIHSTPWRGRRVL